MIPVKSAQRSVLNVTEKKKGFSSSRENVELMFEFILSVVVNSVINLPEFVQREENDAFLTL